MPVRGSLFVLHQFDVCEAIRMDELNKLLGGLAARGELATREPRQTQVWFESPPVIQPLGEIEFAGKERFRAEMHYYSYGVVSLRLERAFELEWSELTELSERWISAPAAQASAEERVRGQLAGVQSALFKPYDLSLSEDYTILRLDPLSGGQGILTGEELLERHGGSIAQLVRGDAHPLAREEEAHVLASRLSYYPSDLIVAGWSAACVYDTAAGAEATIRLIEYANTQLLEFRFYDEFLTRTLSGVYQLLDQGTGFRRRWRLAREAERLNTVRLDVYELTERADNAAKFLSDMFAARLYRLVSERVGVPDYRRLVDVKLQTAGELYRWMTERIHQSNAMLLEITVVIILIIELIFLFRGKG